MECLIISSIALFHYQKILVVHAPAGFVTNLSASQPAKVGRKGRRYAHAKSANGYFLHIIHCKDCRSVLKAFQTRKNALSIVALVSTALAILVTTVAGPPFVLYDLCV
ncbi:protein TIC [Forsythia ovata]|uniref:Protein TIC n=1 Tax=Forsythia ovata TaxID=205694 RepID=A0ABD1WHD1_9LAMI